MKLKSFIQENGQLIPVEVEIHLLMGLPQIQFLGLPDQALRESSQRIRSALKAQGFQFPKAQQILVNLRPSHLKKTSKGIELAVAMGILWITEQIPKMIFDQNTFFYGELDLLGNVYEPEDIHWGLRLDQAPVVVTGKTNKSECLFRREIIHQLSDGWVSESKEVNYENFYQRPQFAFQKKYSPAMAHYLELVSLSGMNVLLAGAAGSGKSTFAQSVASFLEQPEMSPYYCLKDSWRPVVQPHHSTTPLAFIGGGSPPKPGEVIRAHQGVLILDEFLEFDSQIQESLREPMESGKLRISRSHYFEEFECRFQAVATTNLCPCGDWTPVDKVDCRYSRKKCQSYSEKLSGPILDRFHLVLFFNRGQMSSSKNKLIDGVEIYNKLESVRAWMRSENIKLPQNSIELLESEFFEDSFVRQEIQEREWKSHRRRNAAIVCSIYLALLEKKKKVEISHLREALEMTLHNFERLHRWT